MKTKSLTIAVCIAAGLTLSGCDRIKGLLGGGQPKGQVVATVNGEEITALELRQELGGFSSRDPAVMKQAQQAALQRLIMKNLVVQKAKEQKLDKSADYSLQVKRGEEQLLAQLYQRKIAQSVAVPSRSEAENFVSANPDRFANRRILIVDQLVAPPSKITPEQLRPLKTLEEVRSLYEANGLPSQTNVATIDTLTLPPQVLTQIDKLPPGEIFVLPERGSLLFNRVTGVRSAPFGGDAAIAYATNVLRQQKAQQAVVAQLEVMRKGAEKSITYNDAYKPPPPAAKGAAPKAGAAPAAKAPALPAAAAAPAAAPAKAP